MKTIVDLVEEQKEYLLEKDTAAKQAVEANIAPVEADASSASRAYVVGEQLFLNDVLYDVTSPISVGDAIAVGTNITAANKLSADIKSKIDDLYLKDQAFMKQITVNGAVNELDHTGVTDTSGTVKFTVNEDKSITVSANSYPVTLDSTTTFFFFGTNSTAVPNIFKGKKFVGCPSGGASGTYRIIIQEFSSTTPSGAVAESSDVGEGANISNGDYIRMYIRFGSGYQLTSALTFKPMISLPELGLSYDDYVPYAKTNQELTAENQTLTSAFANNINENGCKNILDVGARYRTGTMDSKVTIVDDVITVNGTQSSSTTLRLCPAENDNSYVLPAGTYIIVGERSDTNLTMTLRKNGNDLYAVADPSTPREFTANGTDYFQVMMRLAAASYSNATMKLMICLKSDYEISPKWEPYTKTNLQLTQDSVSWVDAAHIGAVNWCPNDATTQSISDGTTSFTFTVNSDKSVTVSAPSYPVTLASTISLDLHTFTGNEDFVGKTVKASGGVESGIRLVAYRALTADGSAGSVDIEGDAQIFTWANNGSGTKAKMKIEMMSGKTLSEPVTFKPMIAPVDYNGPYVPHAMTNKELTDDVTPSKNTLLSTGIYYQRMGKLVILKVSKDVTLTASQWNVIGTLNSSENPDSDVQFIASVGSGNVANGYIEAATGDIKVSGWEASGSVSVRFNVPYFTA